MKLTQFQFRSRFTTNEKVAIELASLDNPAAAMEQRAMAATLRVLMADMGSAEYVDLTLPATIQGVTMLEQFGIVGPGRAAEILNTDGAEPMQPEGETANVAIHQLGFDGLHRAGEGGTYGVTDVIPVYRDNDATKTMTVAMQVHYFLTGEIK